MTDAHLPGRWLTDPRMDALSDRAWRTFTGSLMWSNEQGTDGEIPQRALRLLHPEGVDGPTAAELVAAVLWKPLDTGFQVLGWNKSQSLAIDVQWQLERNRTNQAAKRKRDREKAQAGRAVTGDVSDYAGGQDRTGKDRLDTKGVPANVIDWPTRTPGAAS